MSVREISQRVAIEYHDAMNGEGLPEAIKRAIHEAAGPLVEALERLADNVGADDGVTVLRDRFRLVCEVRAALAAWKEGQ